MPPPLRSLREEIDLITSGPGAPSNPLAFTPALFQSLEKIDNIPDEDFVKLKELLESEQKEKSASPPAGRGVQPKSTVSPDPSGAPSFAQRPPPHPPTRRSSERDKPAVFTNNVNGAANALGPIPGPSTATRPMMMHSNGSDSIAMAYPRSSSNSRPSPPLSAPATTSGAFDVAYNGSIPPSHFNFAAQSSQWMQSTDTSTPFDPSHIITYPQGSPPYPEHQMHHQRQQMIRGAVMQGMQMRSNSQGGAQGPLHISTPNGTYGPTDFTFPAGNAGHADAASNGLSVPQPPSASSPSPTPSYSSSNVSTPAYGQAPNFIQGSSSGAGGGSAAPLQVPAPTIHHPNPHKVSHSSLRSASRPSPTPESGSNRESGHPYASAANRHGPRTRRHPSDPQSTSPQQLMASVGGVGPDMMIHATRRTSIPGRNPGVRKSTAMSPTMSNAGAGPMMVPRQRIDEGVAVPNIDPATGQPFQYTNLQQWQQAGSVNLHFDNGLHSLPPNGIEYQRTVNRAGSSASTDSSSLAAWNHSTDNLHYVAPTMEMQSPVGADGDSWTWQSTMAASGVDPTMMMSHNNYQSAHMGNSEPAFTTTTALQDAGLQYSPTVAGAHDNFFHQDGLALNHNGQHAQSPKQFSQSGGVNGIAVSPPSEIQTQPGVWNQQTVQASMGLQQQ